MHGLRCLQWAERQSRAEHVIHDTLKLWKNTTKHCLALQENIKGIMKTSSRKTCSSFKSFSPSVPSFIFAVKFLPTRAFSILTISLIPTGALESRVQTLAGALYEGCVLEFNWDSPFAIMWISLILCPAAPFFFNFTPQLTVFFILRNLSLCYLSRLNSVITFSMISWRCIISIRFV